MSGRTLRVGNGAGFWGDNLDAPIHLARDGRLDVLTLEYLAELTLAILAHQRSRDPRSGFVGDFAEVLGRLTPILADQSGLKVVTNAGGLNVRSLAQKVGTILERAGQGSMSVGVVEGDDVLSQLAAWCETGVDLSHMDTGESIDGVMHRLVCANAYLGARPIADGLADGARIVLTGRVADASLTLGPALAHFGWRMDDWSRLAGASAAGHVIECGAQATGGLWQDWTELPDLDRIGYPIAELHEDGTSDITKPEGSGGVVSRGTVAEQLVYEIDDPCCYRTPDVNVDLTTVRLHDYGADRVRIEGTSGAPPPNRLKVSAVYTDGWTASGLLAVVGRGAAAKARAAGHVLIERVRRAGYVLEQSLVEVIGAGDIVPGVVVPPAEPFEVMLRVTARDHRREAVERFCREFAPLVTSGPSGVAGYATGRPVPRPAFGYWPLLVPRDLVESRVRSEVKEAAEWAGEGINPR